MSITITSNHHVRPLVPVMWDAHGGGWYEANEFEVESGRTADGFHYRGWLYAVEEFEVASHDIKRQGFDGFQADSHGTGVVVTYWDKEGNDLDGIIVGYLVAHDGDNLVRVP